jgi:uridine kinase
MASVIGVAGAPGSGKSALVDGLARALPQASAIHMDGYDNMTRLPIEAVARWYREGADIDAFAFPQLEEDLGRLKAGAPVREPLSGIAVAPAHHVLFETQFGRAHRATGRHIDLLVWVDTPLDVALARSTRALLARALGEADAAQRAARLRWLQGYLDNYLGTVRELLEMQKARVAAQADFVVDGRHGIAELVAAARAEILRRLP